jgi:hypothetical protein
LRRAVISAQWRSQAAASLTSAWAREATMADPDDDLQRRLAETLGNALTPGDCCSPDTRPLRNQIINLLFCDACQDMSFRVADIRISGSLYRAVAYSLDGPRHRYHIRIDPGLEKFEGQFEKDRFVFKFDAIGGGVPEMARRCETIIHECTHACIAMTGRTVRRDHNEVAAWLAGVLFLRGQGLPIGGELDFRKNLRALADDARKANVRRQTYVVPTEGVEALRKDINLVYELPPNLIDRGGP